MIIKTDPLFTALDVVSYEFNKPNFGEQTIYLSDNRIYIIKTSGEFVRIR